MVRGQALRFAVFRKGVRGCEECDKLHVVISGDDRSGSVVQLHVADPSGPDVAITPRMIADAAERALDAGWRPGQGTGVFVRFPVDSA